MLYYLLYLNHAKSPLSSVNTPNLCFSNKVMNQVAVKNQIPFEIQEVESLNQNDALNNQGINIYRQALLKILGK
jgi:hypothetical protein